MNAVVPPASGLSSGGSVPSETVSDVAFQVINYAKTEGSLPPAQQELLDMATAVREADPELAAAIDTIVAYALVQLGIVPAGLNVSELQAQYPADVGVVIKSYLAQAQFGGTSFPDLISVVDKLLVLNASLPADAKILTDEQQASLESAKQLWDSDSVDGQLQARDNAIGVLQDLNKTFNFANEQELDSLGQQVSQATADYEAVKNGPDGGWGDLTPEGLVSFIDNEVQGVSSALQDLGIDTSGTAIDNFLSNGKTEGAGSATQAQRAFLEFKEQALEEEYSVATGDAAIKDLKTRQRETDGALDVVGVIEALGADPLTKENVNDLTAEEMVQALFNEIGAASGEKFQAIAEYYTGLYNARLDELGVGSDPANWSAQQREMVAKDPLLNLFSSMKDWAQKWGAVAGDGVLSSSEAFRALSDRYFLVNGFWLNLAGDDRYDSEVRGIALNQGKTTTQFLSALNEHWESVRPALLQ